MREQLVDDDRHGGEPHARGPAGAAQPKIAETRATYFDPIMAGKATNILFVNGSEDPWSTLSLTDPSALPPGIDVLVVRGGSHCEDLSNLDKGMLSGVFEAHLKFNHTPTAASRTTAPSRTSMARGRPTTSRSWLAPRRTSCS